MADVSTTRLLRAVMSTKGTCARMETSPDRLGHSDDTSIKPQLNQLCCNQDIFHFLLNFISFRSRGICKIFSG